MKLRIHGNQLRFRLAPDEVRILVERGRLGDGLLLDEAPAGRLSYELRCAGDAERAGCSFRDGRILVRLNAPAVREWAASDALGMEEEIRLGTEVLNVLVEKDLRPER